MIYPIPYKDTLAAKGSQLAAAIAESPAAAKKIHDETAARFDAMYPGAKDDRVWFSTWRKREDAKSAPQIDQ